VLIPVLNYVHTTDYEGIQLIATGLCNLLVWSIRTY